MPCVPLPSLSSSHSCRSWLPKLLTSDVSYFCPAYQPQILSIVCTCVCVCVCACVCVCVCTYNICMDLDVSQPTTADAHTHTHTVTHTHLLMNHSHSLVATPLSLSLSLPMFYCSILSSGRDGLLSSSAEGVRSSAHLELGEHNSSRSSCCSPSCSDELLHNVCVCSPYDHCMSFINYMYIYTHKYIYISSVIWPAHTRRRQGCTVTVHRKTKPNFGSSTSSNA